MVRIRFVEISGLYSYGSDKNRIGFGEKTVIIGTNNAGKSSIFKALKLFLKTLTEFDNLNRKPWDKHGVHEMTVGLTLDCEERRYAAEVLLVLYRRESGSFSLAPEDAAKRLEPELEQISLTIRWDDSSRQYTSYQTEYTLHLENLGIAVCATGYNGDAWVLERPKFPIQHGTNPVPVFNVIADLVGADSETKTLGAVLGQQSVQVSKFPNFTFEVKTKTPLRDRRRVEFVAGMSGNRTFRDERSLFVMLGYMLGQRFAFVSERRNFLESNDLEKLPLKDDGSNLQSFLFWLQNGSRDRREKYSAIQKRFEAVLGRQNLSFAVSVVEKGEQQDPLSEGAPKGIYPSGATILFDETSKQGQRSADFMSVGAGVRETLFLLTKCFERRDRVILLDEPVTNLHPTQIRRLMDEILTPNDQGVGSGQVVIITHSPLLASREMLASANEIVRVDRPAYSRIVQPSGDDKRWIEGNLAAFHLLKSDILFAKKVVLVEGSADKFFLEAILNHDKEHGAAGEDIAVTDVGGSSFDRFRKLLGIFEIPFVILADNDAKNRFDPDEVLEINSKSLSQADDGGKIVYLLQKDLEHYLSCLEPDLYEEIEGEFRTKPERAYHFVRRFFAGDDSDADRDTLPLRHLMEWIMKDCSSANMQKVMRAAP